MNSHSTSSQKVAFLIEMFEGLDPTFIEQMVANNANQTLEELVTNCLNFNETQQPSPPAPQHAQQGEFTDMISLIPASTTSYFTHDSPTDEKQNSADHTDKSDIASHSLLRAIPTAYHAWFGPYLQHHDVHTIVDICTHLTLMREQHRVQYQPIATNGSHSQYTELKSAELTACISMVHTLMRNMHHSPTVDKYRRIRCRNKAFQKRIAHINGSSLLLKLCGWDWISAAESGLDADGVYIFNTSLSHAWIEMVASFVGFYINANKSPKKQTTSIATTSIDDEYPIIANLPRKKLKVTSNAAYSQPQHQKKQKPKIHKLSAADLRQKRLQNLGDIHAAHYGAIDPNQRVRIGPIADKVMDVNAPNLRNELKKIGHRKHQKWLNSRSARKRIFTMRDIERLRKEEFDRQAKGPKTSDALDAIGREALRLTNEFRKSHGLQPCTWHQSLCDIGKVHSTDMAEGKVPFGHQGFNGRVQQYPFRPRSAAENVAMSNGLSNVAQVAVNGWIESPGHKKNLLSNNNYCGIGVYRGYNGAYYLTQLFGLTNI